MENANRTRTNRFRITFLATALLALAFSSSASAASFALPGGSLQLDSIGVAELDTDSDTQLSALHVRLVATNSRDVSGWTLDTRSVLATVAGEGTSRPAFANVDAGSLPLVALALGETRTIDLYFPLASATQPGFTVSFQLQTGSGLVANSAAFAAELPAAQASLGYGAIWWYDASYPRHGFRNRPVFRAVPQRHAIVVRARPVAPRLKNKGKPFAGYRAPALEPAPVYRAPAPRPAPVYRAPAPRPYPIVHGPAAPVTVRAPAAPARAPIVVRAPAAGSNGHGHGGNVGHGHGKRW